MSAPARTHKCQLVNTTVQISFPGLKAEVGVARPCHHSDPHSKVGVNLLGYREPRLVHVMRCQGLCRLGVACVPSSVDRRTITMMLKTSHTGSEAKTEKQEVALEEHLACACDCDQQEKQECSGR